MARLNVAARHQAVTHEGGPAFSHLTPVQQLRRSVLSCLLWEDQFYEDGKAIAERIVASAEAVAPEALAVLAIEARSVFHLRHAPLLLLEVLTRTGKGRLVADTIAQTIQRADDITEFLAIYWHGGGRKSCQPGHGKSLSSQARQGLQRAFGNFDEYQLAKYDRDAKVKLRDAIRLARPKPGNETQSALWKRVKERALTTPDTWEVALSGGADKKQAFERLIRERKLGYFALLRNLRNMAQANVDVDLVSQAIVARKGGAQRVLPFRYVAAARAAPQFERAIDQALLAAIGEMDPLPGRTLVLVDVSGSMDAKLSAKSDLKRIDAAAALAAIVPGDVRLFTFSDALVEVPARRGMAGVDAIIRSQSHGGTRLGAALACLARECPSYDRIIVVSDEQAHDRVELPAWPRAYMINIASYRNGVGYGRWTHIDGFSEGVLRYIAAVEQ
jgi:60 kDa SS-A/Ro ribonucleoprotein